MPELIVRGISKRFGSVPAVEDVSFTVRDGEFFTLLGPSGCGKSTMLSMIAGLSEPNEGFMQLGGTVLVDMALRQIVPAEKRNLGMVFQSYALWPHMTVEQNLAVPLKLRRVSAAERKRRIGSALEHVELQGLQDRYPHELSGGQQQRVALARSLVYQPSLLLLDEPLSNLDAKVRDRAREWLKRIQRDVGITTIYVTHDQLEALSLSDRIAVMGNRKVLQIGSPTEIYEQPASPNVAAFVGRCNFLSGVVADQSGTALDGLFVRLDGTQSPIWIESPTRFAGGTRVKIAVRAEKLGLSPAGPGIDSAKTLIMTIASRAYVGARFEYQLKFGDQLVHAEDTVAHAGGSLAVVVPSSGCVVFEERGAT